MTLDATDTNPASPAAPGARTLPLAAGHWEIDAFHSAVNFSIRHLGISKVRGRFAEVGAELVVGESAETSSVTATIALASIDTGNKDRDAHVRASDLLDVEKRPTMTFRSTRIEGTGEEWSMAGELTIGEVTRPVTLAVEFGGVEGFPGQDRKHAGFEASGEIRRSEFGLDFAPGLLGEVVKIQLDMQFLEPVAREG
ncbi:YceI family protein [Streptomyces kanamyceticus]|uniref:YceI family protein n=1 Tax=Streptomyces kanamyceticus TaxID=1967 RepID=A0A5J6GJ28_STRKN|nr:YceI family protein [Streptomyces kanamyceticus]QEU95107.1 YceI family protein [Streptomyces kanamyceticus]